MKNIITKLIYNLFRNKARRLDLSSRTLVFSDDMKTLDNFTIKDNEFYNDNDVWFTKDMVEIVPEGICLHLKKDWQVHETWQGKRRTKWKAGMIDTTGKVEQSLGVWVVETNNCDSWPAIWLLKNAREVIGHTKKTIIPEIDVMEVIKHKVRHTLHYGYVDTDEYRKTGTGSSIFKFDNLFHEFAVELLPDGYDFFIDGYLSATFRSEDPEFVTLDPNFLILNNAGDRWTANETKFIIKSVKVYK